MKKKKVILTIILYLMFAILIGIILYCAIKFLKVILLVMAAIIALKIVLYMFDDINMYEVNLRQKIAEELNIQYSSDEDLRKKVKFKIPYKYNNERPQTVKIKVNKKVQEHTVKIDEAIQIYYKNVSAKVDELEKKIDEKFNKIIPKI